MASFATLYASSANETATGIRGHAGTEKAESLKKENSAPPVGATTTPVIPKRAIYHTCLLPDPAADGSAFDSIPILAVIFAIPLCLHLFVFQLLV